jgi:archaellin
VNKKAETGLMILFIAMILVASIAATVFFQTATSLQNKALQTGKAVRQVVNSKAVVIGTSRYNITNISTEYRIKLKLTAGSDAINLQKSLLSLTSDDGELELLYSPGRCEYNQVEGYYSDTTYKNGSFAVRHIIGSKTGYLFPGDIIEVCFIFIKFSSSDKITSAAFVPSTGIPTQIRTRY